MGCEDLWCPQFISDTLQLVVDDLYNGLSCTTNGSPKDGFISHTAPPDDCCDFVAVWMDRLDPTREFPLVNTTFVDRCGETGRMALVKARVRRSCYPVIKDNARSPFPSAGEMQAAAEALLMDANVVWCRLVSAFGEGVYALSEPECAAGCLNFKMEQLVMDPPRGGCAGFTVSFWMELEGCC